MKQQYEIGKVYDTPRPCPKCRNVRAEFRTTATDYGEWWRCVNCGYVFGSREEPFDRDRVSIGGVNITAIQERLRDLEKRVGKLEQSK